MQSLSYNSTIEVLFPKLQHGPIFNSHVFVIIGTLGWGDKISLSFEVEGLDYHYNIECQEMFNWFNTPTSQTSYPTCEGCSGMGGYDWAKRFCFTNAKL